MRRLLLAAVLMCAACPTIDVGDNPVAPPECKPSYDDFKKPGGIWDIAIDPSDQSKSCIAMSGCHAQATGRSALRLIAKPRAMLTESDWMTNYSVITLFLNCSSPADSPFVTKPEAGVEPHLGGDLWTCSGTSTCEPEATIEAWIAAH